MEELLVVDLLRAHAQQGWAKVIILCVFVHCLERGVNLPPSSWRVADNLPPDQLVGIPSS